MAQNEVIDKVLDVMTYPQTVFILPSMSKSFLVSFLARLRTNYREAQTTIVCKRINLKTRAAVVVYKQSCLKVYHRLCVVIAIGRYLPPSQNGQVLLLYVGMNLWFAIALKLGIIGERIMYAESLISGRWIQPCYVSHSKIAIPRGHSHTSQSSSNSMAMKNGVW
jgi:hypothetical protein